jgi:hypothetical protein
MSNWSGAPNQWSWLWGIFRIPPGTAQIRFFLMQSQLRGEPHEGLPARFDDLGLYIFSTEEAARNFVRTTTGDDTNQVRIENNVTLSRCGLTLAQSPEMYGLRLGMSLEEALNLFPGSREDVSIRREIERTMHISGAVSLIFNANRHHNYANLPNAKEFWLRFLDNRLYALHIEYNNPLWNHVDDFIKNLPQVASLPSTHTWQSIGNQSKYLICNNFEFRVFASYNGASDYVSLTNLDAERTLTARRMSARQ